MSGELPGQSSMLILFSSCGVAQIRDEMHFYHLEWPVGMANSAFKDFEEL
jgi:hypothetical protein